MGLETAVTIQTGEKSEWSGCLQLMMQPKHLIHVHIEVDFLEVLRMVFSSTFCNRKIKNVLIHYLLQLPPSHSEDNIQGEVLTIVVLAQTLFAHNSTYTGTSYLN